MKLLSLSLLLLLAATVSQGRPSVSVSELIELVTSPNVVETEANLLEKQRLSISYPNCRSWHLAVETGNIKGYDLVPANCKDYVEDYLITSYQYRNDSKTVCKEAYFYAKEVTLQEDTINVWIFDLDDTLLSSIPFYAEFGYGTEHETPGSREKFLEAANAPVLPETLHLYENIQELGIRPIIISERPDNYTDVSILNLRRAGFSNWEQAIFLSPKHANLLTGEYKLLMRKEIERSGYKIIGNVGDLWDDFLEDGSGGRNFKLPNPMYWEP